ARRHGFGEWRLGDEARPGRRAEKGRLPAARLLPGSSRTWLGAASVLLALAAWQGVVAAGLVPGDLVPPPTAVWRAFVEILRHGYRDTTLGEDIGATLGRALAGFGLGALLGVPLGLWMGMSRRASAAFGWIVQFMRPLPPLSFLVLLILWLGLGEASKIALLTMTAFPIITSASQAAVRGVPELQIAVARSLGATPRQVFGHVVLPASLPMIFTGLNIALAATFSTVVAAELLAANDGLGWMVLSASKFLRNDIIMVGIVLLGVLGMALSRFLLLLDRRLVHWRGRA
ncbi:MAG TPA: ABC transporter permease, partial [Acetobacteraceae bacterium]|nr:ABC transporter permease [Acetobacteraceae bacterium]